MCILFNIINFSSFSNIVFGAGKNQSKVVLYCNTLWNSLPLPCPSNSCKPTCTSNDGDLSLVNNSCTKKKNQVLKGNVDDDNYEGGEGLPLCGFAYICAIMRLFFYIDRCGFTKRRGLRFLYNFRANG